MYAAAAGFRWAPHSSHRRPPPPPPRIRAAVQAKQVPRCSALAGGREEAGEGRYTDTHSARVDLRGPWPAAGGRPGAGLRRGQKARFSPVCAPSAQTTVGGRIMRQNSPPVCGAAAAAYVTLCSATRCHHCVCEQRPPRERGSPRPPRSAPRSPALHTRPGGAGATASSAPGACSGPGWSLGAPPPRRPGKAWAGEGPPGSSPS